MVYLCVEARTQNTVSLLWYKLSACLSKGSYFGHRSIWLALYVLINEMIRCDSSSFK